jgi:hypothetical protein
MKITMPFGRTSQQSSAVSSADRKIIPVASLYALAELFNGDGFTLI